MERTKHAASRRLACAVLAVVLLAGCGKLAFLDDVGRTVDDAVNGAARIGDDVQLPGVPRPVPAGQLDTIAAEADRLAALIVEQYSDDLDNAGVTRLVDDACTAKDWVETGVADSIPEAAQKIVADNGGNSTFRFRVEALATDLQKAESSGDAAWNLASFAVCETVGAGQ